MTTRLIIARILLLGGLGVGLLNRRESVGHIGNPDFRVPGYTLAPSHSWYHVFHEVCGNVAKVTIFLLIFFGRSSWRIPITWWIGLILMVGYYAPFWIGEPILPALAAPNRPAGVIHVAMATLSILALVVARPLFQTSAKVSQ